MNLESAVLQKVAMIAAVVAGSAFSAAQDPKPPAPTPPVAPPAVQAPPAAQSDSLGGDEELLDDALRDFGAADDAFANAFQPFTLSFDPQLFKLGAAGATGSFESTTTENGKTKRVHVDVSPDGKAKATVTTEEQNGDKSETTYEADSVDALEAQAPELKAALTGGFSSMTLPALPGFPRAFGAAPLRGPAQGLQRLPRSQRGPLAAPAAVPPLAGPRLGVQVKSIDADDPLRSQLRLDDGVGLLIESVVPGSLADTLKLERFDVLMRINDATIRETADVAIELKAAGDGALEVHVIRGGEPLVLTKGT